jgi:uncharacterized protein (DUF58 family)
VKSGGWSALLIVFFLVAIALRRDLLAIFAAVLALATGASALWARYCLTNLSYRRRLGSHAINLGEETTLTLEFENAKPLPLAWVLVHDPFPTSVDLLTGPLQYHPPGEEAALVSLLSLKWYERVTRVHRIRGTRRGRYDFGPPAISSGDMFGYQRRTAEGPDTDELLVFPRLLPLEELGLPTGRPVGEWFATRRVVPDPLRFAGVRTYAPGDNPRYVHWRASARTNSLQVKEFDPSDTLTLMIAVDVQTLPRSYDYLAEALEYVISAAASIALYALDERHMVGLCANSLTRKAETWARVAPGRHVRQATELLSLLAELGPFRGTPMERMLDLLMSDLPFGASVVALTALPRAGIYEALDGLQRAGHPVLLLTTGTLPPTVPDSIPHHHLGEEDDWEAVPALELA